MMTCIFLASHKVVAFSAPDLGGWKVFLASLPCTTMWGDNSPKMLLTWVVKVTPTMTNLFKSVETMKWWGFASSLVKRTDATKFRLFSFLAGPAMTFRPPGRPIALHYGTRASVHCANKRVYLNHHREWGETERLPPKLFWSMAHSFQNAHQTKYSSVSSGNSCETVKHSWNSTPPPHQDHHQLIGWWTRTFDCPQSFDWTQTFDFFEPMMSLTPSCWPKARIIEIATSKKLFAFSDTKRRYESLHEGTNANWPPKNIPKMQTSRPPQTHAPAPLRFRRLDVISKAQTPTEPRCNSQSFIEGYCGPQHSIHRGIWLLWPKLRKLYVQKKGHITIFNHTHDYDVSWSGLSVFILGPCVQKRKWTTTCAIYVPLYEPNIVMSTVSPTFFQRWLYAIYLYYFSAFPVTVRDGGILDSRCHRRVCSLRPSIREALYMHPFTPQMYMQDCFQLSGICQRFLSVCPLRAKKPDSIQGKDNTWVIQITYCRDTLERNPSKAVKSLRIWSNAVMFRGSR